MESLYQETNPCKYSYNNKKGTNKYAVKIIVNQKRQGWINLQRSPEATIVSHDKSVMMIFLTRWKPSFLSGWEKMLKAMLLVHRTRHHVIKGKDVSPLKYIQKVVETKFRSCYRHGRLWYIAQKICRKKVSHPGRNTQTINLHDTYI